MAVISPDTFNPLNRYVGVRLQQGVPIVDADENEREDIRQFELRAYLRWFVGDGIPEGNDGFRIDISGASMNNNFVIRAGAPTAPVGTSDLQRGLNHVGRCLVDGLDVIIQNDLNFTAQTLHNSQAGAAALAAAWGVPVIDSVPNINGVAVVYLDVWRRLLTPAERPALVHPGLGTESCARFIREWAVRVRSSTGGTAPNPGDADYIAGHSYYVLARINRRLGDPLIFPVDVIDRREKRLLTPPATLITDLFGINAADYRMGLGRPAISLRDAINSLLRGEVPSTPDTAISPAPGVDAMRRGFFFDQGNGVIAVWSSARTGTEQVFAARLDQNNVAGGFSQLAQITSGAVLHAEPHGVVLPNGELIVVYRTGSGAAADIMFKRGTFSTLAAAAEQTVVGTAGGQTLPSVLISGNTAVFIFFDVTTIRLQYRRFNLTTNTFTDAAPVTIATPANVNQDYHAVVDGAGNIWIAVRMGADLRALRLNPTSGAIDQEITVDSGVGQDDQPFLLPMPGNNMWLFWHTPNDLRIMPHNGTIWQGQQPITGTNNTDQQPVAVRETDDGVWLIWPRGAVGTRQLFMSRRNPLTGQWGEPRLLTSSVGDNSAPFPIMAPNSAIWLFWASDRSGNVDIYFKRLVTSV